MRKKGFVGWLAVFFAIGAFVALFLFIFLYFFKFHVTMMMVDFYFWNKEYDIPMALFSTDIDTDTSEDGENFESSVIVLNKMRYGMYTDSDEDSEMNQIKGQLRDVINEWYGYELEHGYYVLKFEGFELHSEENPCTCQYEGGIVSPWTCHGSCKTDFGDYRHLVMCQTPFTTLSLKVHVLYQFFVRYQRNR